MQRILLFPIYCWADNSMWCRCDQPGTSPRHLPWQQSACRELPGSREGCIMKWPLLGYCHLTSPIIPGPCQYHLQMAAKWCEWDAFVGEMRDVIMRLGLLSCEEAHNEAICCWAAGRWQKPAFAARHISHLLHHGDVQLSKRQFSWKESFPPQIMAVSKEKPQLMDLAGMGVIHVVRHFGCQ